MAEKEKSGLCKQCFQTLRFGPKHLFPDIPLSTHIDASTDEELQFKDWLRFYEYSHLALNGNSAKTNANYFDYACRLFDEPDGENDIFMYVTTSDYSNGCNEMEIRAAVSDILLDESNLTHPLCEYCTDTLVTMMNESIEQAENDRNDYCNYLKILESERPDLETEKLEKELKHQEIEEQSLLQSLMIIDEEEAEDRKSITEQQLEFQRLTNKEERYLRQIAEHEHDFMDTEDVFESAEKWVACTTSRMAQLAKSNVFNDAFHMTNSGCISTIGNFRLGTKADLECVPCSEINAAWGQVALLLAALARKLHLTFEKYKLVPYGSRSYIQVLSDQKILPLFTSRGSRYTWDTDFDSAMLAFLNCMEQLHQKMVQGDRKDFKLPYEIHEGKIRHPAKSAYYPIRTLFASEEDWTTVMKLMLTNLEWLLTAVSRSGMQTACNETLQS